MPFDDKGEWKPVSKAQTDFLRLPDSIKEGFFGGSAGPGKTEVLLMYAVVRGWHNVQGFKQLFLRRSYPEIIREILPRTKLMYERLGAEYNRSDKYWTFPREDQYGSGAKPNGGLIFFGHCETEDDVHNYDGMEINLFTPDELTSFTEYIYTYIGFTRVRTTNPSLPAIIRASGMPGDIGHSFVKKRFIDPDKNGGKIIIGRGGNKRIYIHSTFKDNTKLDPNYGQGLEALPDEAERRAKKGDWSSYEGQVFDEFRDKHYPSEPEHALHVVDPFVIPKHWPRICAIDWGYSAMCSVGWGAISPEPRVYVYRHQVFYREKIEEWGPKVKLFIDSDIPSDIVICHSANQHRGDPHSILEQVTNALGGVSIRLGEKDRIAGKILIHEYLRWRAFDTSNADDKQIDAELAQWILRNKGTDDYKRYCAMFTPVEEEKLPKLRFHNTPDIKMIWDALRQCIYEKADKLGKKKEDVAEFAGDDPYDMLRMLVHAADQFFATAKDLQNRLNMVDNVVNMFQSTGDMTGYYRNMRRIESISSEVKAVSRYHGRGRR